MQTTWLSPKVSGAHIGIGEGLVALAPIAPEEAIVVWGGVLCTRAELARFPALVSANCVQIDIDTYLLQPHLTAGDRVNHSCAPSCGFAGDRTLVSLRALSPGEEITYDYARSDICDYDEFECFCGAPTCRKKIKGMTGRTPNFAPATQAICLPTSTLLSGVVSSRGRLHLQELLKLLGDEWLPWLHL